MKDFLSNISTENTNELNELIYAEAKQVTVPKVNKKTWMRNLATKTNNETTLASKSSKEKCIMNQCNEKTNKYNDRLMIQLEYIQTILVKERKLKSYRDKIK